MIKIINFLLFQICWFACTIGARYAISWLGTIAVIVAAIVNLFFSKSKANDVCFWLLVTIIGTIFDGLCVKMGVYSFVAKTDIPWGYPLWMSALWLNFALIVRSSVQWLHGRYYLAALLGSLGGSLSYLAGERLGIIVVSDSSNSGYFAIALLWLIITPLIFFISKKMKRE